MYNCTIILLFLKMKMVLSNLIYRNICIANGALHLSKQRGEHLRTLLHGR